MYALSHTLSADGRWLAAIEANGQSCESVSGGNACRARADALHLVDVATWQGDVAGRPRSPHCPRRRRPVDDGGPGRPLGKYGVHRDGAVVVGKAPDVESQGLQVIDPTNGRLLETRDTQADRVRITPDGAYLLLDGWNQNGYWTEIVDAGSLETLARLNEWEITVTPQNVGDLTLLASRSSGQVAEFAVLQPPAFALEAAWSVNGPASWLAP